MSVSTAIGVLMVAVIAYSAIQGWHTGTIRIRSFEVSRQDNPVSYWSVMAFHGFVLIGILLAELGIYGEPLAR